MIHTAKQAQLFDTHENLRWNALETNAAVRFIVIKICDILEEYEMLSMKMAEKAETCRRH
jgi:hypothetical protein